MKSIGQMQDLMSARFEQVMTALWGTSTEQQEQEAVPRQRWKKDSTHCNGKCDIICPGIGKKPLILQLPVVCVLEMWIRGGFKMKFHCVLRQKPGQYDLILKYNRVWISRLFGK